MVRRCKASRWRKPSSLCVLTFLVCTSPMTAIRTHAQEPEYIWSINNSLWNGPSVGEDYTIELTGGLWEPTPAVVASSEQFGILGSTIDFQRDLGLSRRQQPDFRITLKTGRKHKLRVSVTPIAYSQQVQLERRLVFQGIAYDASETVSSALQWNAWRFGYEYDVISRDRGYFGFLFETKYPQLKASITSADTHEYVRAKAPIPAAGGILRLYPTRFTAITAEFTGFKLPASYSDNYRAQYVEFEVFTTVNLSRKVGVNLGYRSVDLSYLVNRDTGDLKLDGLYVSGTFRY